MCDFEIKETYFWQPLPGDADLRVNYGGVRAENGKALKAEETQNVRK